MARQGFVGSLWSVGPWLLALLGALLLTQELTPATNTLFAPPVSAPGVQPAPRKEEHKEEVVFQPWEHVST